MCLIWPFRIAKDERFERLPCMHKGIYADDCLVNRATQVKPNLVHSFRHKRSVGALLSKPA